MGILGACHLQEFLDLSLAGFLEDVVAGRGGELFNLVEVYGGHGGLEVVLCCPNLFV